MRDKKKHNNLVWYRATKRCMYFLFLLFDDYVNEAMSDQQLKFFKGSRNSNSVSQ